MQFSLLLANLKIFLCVYFYFPLFLTVFFTIPIGITRASFSLAFSISAVDLGDMQSTSKFNKGRRFLLCIIDLFSKYVWVVPLKSKKGATIVNAFLMHC